MVDPVDNTERVAFLRKLKVGFALLVGLSAGLMGLQTGAGLVVLAAAVVAGSLVGAFLAWLALPSGDDLNTRKPRRSRRRKCFPVRQRALRRARRASPRRRPPR